MAYVRDVRDGAWPIHRCWRHVAGMGAAYGGADRVTVVVCAVTPGRHCGVDGHS